MLDVKFAHVFKKIDSFADVILVIFKWFLDGFADGLETGKVNNGVKVSVIEDVFEFCVVK